MPCTDGNPLFDRGWDAAKLGSKREHEALTKRLAKMEALLCGAFTALEKQGYRIEKVIDWAEVGVTPEAAQRWWKAHRKADALRKAREALTPEELKLLGVKE